MLVVIVDLLIVFIAVRGDDAAAKLMITGVFAPIVGIVGTVLGFYYGADAASKD